MNVVFTPALAFASASLLGDAVPCLNGECLLGWIWSILALTFVSAWIVRRWQTESILTGPRRLAPLAVCGFPAGVTQAEQSHQTAPPVASNGLRAPPTTRSSLPRLLSSRSTGSPSKASGSSRERSSPEAPPGQSPPA